MWGVALSNTTLKQKKPDHTEPTHHKKHTTYKPQTTKQKQLAKAAGDFLLVGLHTDDDVSARRGPHLPIMNVHERALSVLACKYVDEVVIGAPPVVTATLLSTFRISRVVRGGRSETGSYAKLDPERYALPRSRGIYLVLDSPCPTTTSNIISRIVDNRKAYEARNAKKVANEDSYYADEGKAFVQEV